MRELIDLLNEINNSSPEKISAMRESIIRQDCPFCGKTGFNVVCIHIVQKHGIGRRELSDALGFDYTQTICSVEAHERTKLNSANKNPRAYSIAAGKTPDFSKRVYSKSGRETVLKNLKPPSHSPEKLKELGRMVGLSNKGRRISKVSHGTYAEYKRGCRCQECVDAFRLHWRNWRLNKKTPA